MLQVEVKDEFKKAPAAQYQAVCAEVMDLGYITKQYKNADTGALEPKQVHEIVYVFQLNKVDPDTGKRYEIRSAPFNLILSEKANLRKFLLQFRGHDLTAAELKPPGVDVDLTGRNCQIQVVHNVSGDKTYANIGSIMPLMEGMPEIVAENYTSGLEQEMAYRAKKAAGDLNGGGSIPAFSGQAAQQSAPVLQPQAGAAAVNMSQPGETRTDIPF